MHNNVKLSSNLRERKLYVIIEQKEKTHVATIC